MLTAPPLTRNLTDGSLVRVETFRISREKLVAESRDPISYSTTILIFSRRKKEGGRKIDRVNSFGDRRKEEKRGDRMI